MSTAQATTLSADELTRIVRSADPSALFVPPRILRRVIKKHRGLGGLGLNVPHARCYLIDRGRLLDIATRGELGLAGTEGLPDEVLLLPRPDDAVLRARPAAGVLREVWRLLFHGAVHRALAATSPDVPRWIEAIGRISFEEAREVLRQENDLFDPGDDREVIEEFACTYLELRHFDPHRLGQFFPTIDSERVDAALARDVDAAALLERTRPAGAAGPILYPALPPRPVEPQPPAAESIPPGALRSRAERVSRRGNLVRAAILRYKALRLAPPTQAGGLRGAARRDIEVLVTRLERALHFPARDRADWLHCLHTLLEPAARGFWPVEARLLYDLQKVCIDNERAIYAVDLVEWFVSAFRQPIKRPLPDQPLVLTVEHLRKALGRLTVARIPDAERQRLRELLESALADVEHRLRRTLQPRLVAALEAVGLVPGNAAEQLSRDRLVDELLDRVVECRFLTLGDLRDALARSRLKLPDLAGPGEFFRGDPLIRANRRLAVDLDGVYHRGEIYLRWLQRLTSLFFANPVGRWLTLYLLLPVLGSIFIIKGGNELFELAHKFLHAPEIYIPEFDGISYVVLALFLLPMLHWPAFRHGVLRGLHYAWLVLRGLLVDLPAAFFRWPLVRLVLQSRAYVVFYLYLGRPVLLTLPVTLVLWLLGVDLVWVQALSAGLLVLMSVLSNTRLGLLAEETTTDWLVRTWQLIRDDLVPGLFRSIIFVFNRFKERVERILYTVDEWLRFRTGDSRLSFVTKLVLGFLWFWVTYVVRFAINLLVEPQINPIKHFPVVTVSHKFLLPLAAWKPGAIAVEPSMLASLLLYVTRLSIKDANLVVATVVWGIPGIFGFLAWELKENWRLYRANASPTLDPEMVGSHGERIIGLLRPGFHSGTLPKLYARLRRASGAGERKVEEGLHHVEEAVRHFVQRALVAVISASSAWQVAAKPVVGDVRLGTNRIRFELCCPALAGDSVLIDFEHRAGWLLAGIARAGWLDDLAEGQRAVLASALAGLYKKAGVDLVYQELAAVLPRGTLAEVTREGLAVWAGAERRDGVVYDLNQPEEPPRRIGAGVPGVPADARTLLFSARPVTWNAWVEVWERDRAGKGHEALLPGVALLPASGATVGGAPR